jgi:carboxypeptidase Taq
MISRLAEFDISATNQSMRILDMTRELEVIHTCAATLGWDQETYLPPAAHEHRANQLAWLSAKGHEMQTSDEWRAALEDAEEKNPGTDPKLTANLRELRRQFDRATKLPVELVTRASKCSSMAKHAWAMAREASDFSLFSSSLDELVEIAREKADHLGYPDEPYDALLDSYERATSTATVAKLFQSIEPELRTIAASAVERSKQHAVKLPQGPYPIEDQKRFNQAVAESIGFDFKAGRIDTTTHPFCTTLGPRDVRLTTRYDQQDFTSSLFGILHEAGHGMYEQGLNPDDFGVPSGSAVSLGIHESQSRLWENHVGRSDSFWELWFPKACKVFPQLGSMQFDSFLSYIHRAAYTPIRVEADESTYDLHILLRFSIERRLVTGELSVDDVPAAWNELFKLSFGFEPENDRVGCLQDIHWSMGGLGYFPTYTLGNLHAAQLFAAAKRDLDVAMGIVQGNYAPLLRWLRHEVHNHGATLDPADLIQSATGSKPGSCDYLVHLKNRYL